MRRKIKSDLCKYSFEHMIFNHKVKNAKWEVNPQPTKFLKCTYPLVDKYSFKLDRE